MRAYVRLLKAVHASKTFPIIVAEDNKEMINTIQITKDILAPILPPQELNSMHFGSLPLENTIVGITSLAVSSIEFCQCKFDERNIWLERWLWS